MKKLTFVAALAISAATLSSCGNSTPKADMKNDVDSLSYAFGLDQAQGVKEYLTRMEVDTTYMDEFVKGISDGALSADDKKKNAYNVGVGIGMQLAMMQKNASKQIFAGDSTQTLNIRNLIAGFISGATGKNTKMTVDQARMIEQSVSQAIMQKSMEKQYGPKKEKSAKFMANVAKQPGVKKLANGVCYKVITEGSGDIPADTSMVKLNYEGKTIDGKVFDSSFARKEPATMRANQVIPGFTEALTHMPVGSTWEVYIPQDLAYGDREQGDIKPFSVLIFKIELLGIEK